MSDNTNNAQSDKSTTENVETKSVLQNKWTWIGGSIAAAAVVGAGVYYFVKRAGVNVAEVAEAATGAAVSAAGAFRR